jgi:uncharacterized repeat protein (TIGR03803 family)
MRRKTIGGMLALLVVAFMLFTSSGVASTFKVLHEFAGNDGRYPVDGLVFDTTGNLYGTTVAGGTGGYGTVFKLSPNLDGTWTETVLYSFTGGVDGSTPEDGVTLDAAGDLYGTTYYGGAGGYGTVFKLSPNLDGTWTETLLYSFTGGADGSNPEASVIFDAAGNLYGTTVYGGKFGLGAVFRLSKNSSGTWTETVLYSPDSNAAGCCSFAKLTFDAAGNLYGTWSNSTESDRYGAVFKLSPNSNRTWTYSVLHAFMG